MPFGKRLKRAVILVLFFFCLGTAIGDTVAGPLALVAEETVAGRSAVRSGARMERSGNWLDAIEHYEKSLKRWPRSKELTYGLRRSRIHFSIARRYADGSFESQLLRKTRYEALALFDEVLRQVQAYYVDPISSTSFVAHGTESLYFALANDKFVKRNLQGVESARIGRVRGILREQFWNKPVSHREAARETVAQVCDLAQANLGLPHTVVVMEYLFGGCNVLDDYSSCLTPDRLNDLYSTIEGEFIGIGIEMKSELGKGQLLINVLPESPAGEGGLSPGEHIVRIDGVNCRFMTTDEAARLLRGSVGSRVRLEIEEPLEAAVRERTFVRRQVRIKSIPVARIIDKKEGIAYVRMTGFQKTSATELDETLSRLRREGMRALIWDLRGNPGGLLTAAVEVLDRFIDEGVLVSTRGRTTDQNWSYSAHRPGTTRLPLVLIVDGQSASASEIVAGAIRDHKRGLIVGRQTFGKWSVQSIFPVQNSTGLRLTTAKFYSPRGRTLGKIGVRPDVVVEPDAAERRTTYFRRPSEVDVESDSDLRKGLEILRTQISRR